MPYFAHAFNGRAIRGALEPRNFNFEAHEFDTHGTIFDPIFARVQIVFDAAHQIADNQVHLSGINVIDQVVEPATAAFTLGFFERPAIERDRDAAIVVFDPDDIARVIHLRQITAFIGHLNDDFRPVLRCGGFRSCLTYCGNQAGH